MTAAIEDTFTASNNATLERFYQIVAGGAVVDISLWQLHAQWRYADGSLALDLTRENGLIVVTDGPNGLWKILVQPQDLAAIVPGTITHDALAIPPIGLDGTPRIYRPVEGVVTILQGTTRVWS